MPVLRVSAVRTLMGCIETAGGTIEPVIVALDWVLRVALASSSRIGVLSATSVCSSTAAATVGLVVGAALLIGGLLGWGRRGWHRHGGTSDITGHGGIGVDGWWWRREVLWRLVVDGGRRRGLLHWWGLVLVGSRWEEHWGRRLL